MIVDVQGRLYRRKRAPAVSSELARRILPKRLRFAVTAEEVEDARRERALAMRRQAEAQRRDQGPPILALGQTTALATVDRVGDAIDIATRDGAWP